MRPHQRPFLRARDVALVQALSDCFWPLAQALHPCEVLVHVQALLKAAVKKVLPDIDWEVSLPRPFGSRAYGLADTTSDLDLWVDACPEVIAVGDDIRACIVHALRARKIARDCS